MGATPKQPDGENITLVESDGYVVATDTETGVTSQGETKAEALENLAEAIRLHERPVPGDIEDPDPSDAPWF